MTFHYILTLFITSIYLPIYLSSIQSNPTNSFPYLVLDLVPLPINYQLSQKIIFPPSDLKTKTTKQSKYHPIYQK